MLQTIDPINYTTVFGKMVDNKFHVNRDKLEEKYLKNVDAVITSSLVNLKNLSNKYNFLKNRIYNNYFGYIKKKELSNVISKSRKIRIAYSGSMLSSVQKPENLINIIRNLDKTKVEIYFIGNISVNKKLKKIKDSNIKFINYMEHEEYLKFMSENIDLAFVSLSKDYYSACVPSKIYEYINLELPILGLLPLNSDSIDIINDNKFGFACALEDSKLIVNKINEIISNKNILLEYRSSLKEKKDDWFMKNKIIEVDILLRKIYENSTC